MALQQL
jgi:hypothetical protein